VYRLCIASFEPTLWNKVICDLGNEAQRRFQLIAATLCAGAEDDRAVS